MTHLLALVLDFPNSYAIRLFAFGAGAKTIRTLSPGRLHIGGDPMLLVGIGTSTESSRRLSTFGLVVNLLATRATRCLLRDDPDVSENSDDDGAALPKGNGGILKIVIQTSKGIAEAVADNGKAVFGRYADCILLCRVFGVTVDLP